MEYPHLWNPPYNRISCFEPLLICPWGVAHASDSAVLVRKPSISWAIFHRWDWHFSMGFREKSMGSPTSSPLFQYEVDWSSGWWWFGVAYCQAKRCVSCALQIFGVKHGETSFLFHWEAHFWEREPKVSWGSSAVPTMT